MAPASLLGSLKAIGRFLLPQQAGFYYVAYGILIGAWISSGLGHAAVLIFYYYLGTKIYDISSNELLRWMARTRS